MSHTAVRVTYAGNVGTAFVPDDAKPSKGVSFMHDVDPGMGSMILLVPVEMLSPLDPALACSCGRLATYRGKRCGTCGYEARDFEMLWHGWTGVQS